MSDSAKVVINLATGREDAERVLDQADLVANAELAGATSLGIDRR